MGSDWILGAKRVGEWVPAPRGHSLVNAGGNCGRRRSRLGKGRGEFRWGHMFAAPWEVSIAGALIVQYLALERGLL